jgi:DNA polymerase-3 subunit delta'
VKLIGFEAIKSKFLSSYHNKKLHHAILLNGNKGIGKSSFARELASEILDSKNHSHPDLLIIEKEIDKREIVVDKIRKIADFLNQTAAISPSKFIIIDSACELNKSASNALLKILEEPHANNFLILISHNLNRVLPTIKSRCQIVKIPNLSNEDFRKILLQKNSNLLPEEINFLAEISNNSIAQAIDFGIEFIKLYKLFLDSVKNKSLDESLLKKISEKNFSFRNFEIVFEFFINRLTKFFSSLEIDFYFNEKEIFLNLVKKISQEELFAITDESFQILTKTNHLHLDKRLSVINVFNLIAL